MIGNNFRQKSQPAVLLQDRDRRLLAELAKMRIIDRELTKVVGGFGSTTRANTRLLKLTRAGFLNRFFVGTIGAGRKAVYTLSRQGGVLNGTPYQRISRSHGQTLVSDLFVAHQEAVNQMYVTVKHQPLPDGYRFLVWKSFHEPLSKSSRLIPDGYFELETPQGIRATFLEADLGNQTMAVWTQKIRGYLDLARSGDFTRIFQQPQFRVIVATTSERRLHNIRSTIAKQTPKIFWLADFSTIQHAGFWSPIWLRPEGDQKFAL